MVTVIGTDNTTLVRLVSQGDDISIMPAEWNGMQINPFVLTDEQLLEWNSLPADRGGTLFDGNTFTALPPEQLSL